MVTFETFLVLAAVVVVIGLVIWRRDVKSGRIARPKSLVRSRYVRDLFADTRSPAMGAGGEPAKPPVASPGGDAKPPG